MKNFPRADVVIMAAAVSDYRFKDVSSLKVKKGQLPKAVELVETSDILKKLSKKKGSKVVVGFAAETDDILKNALKKIKEKNLDLIIANDITQEGIGFESDFNQVNIVNSTGNVFQSEKMSKREISKIILDKVEEIVGKKS